MMEAIVNNNITEEYKIRGGGRGRGTFIHLNESTDMNAMNLEEKVISCIKFSEVKHKQVNSRKAK